jgi:uncharacterized protein
LLDLNQTASAKPGAVHGASVNKARALSWYLKAAEQGDADAQNNAGYMLYRGEGSPNSKPNYVEAYFWLRKAAEQDSAAAQTSIASMFLDGLGVVKDEKEALRWYRLGAKGENANAQNQAGGMLLRGAKGIPIDKVEARQWLQLAAAQGHKDAIDTLKSISK